MRNCAWALALAMLVAPATMAKPPQQEKNVALPPPWAYGFDSLADTAAGSPVPAPLAVPAPDDGTLRRLPGSTFSFTLTQIRDSYGPADWYPGDHPQMPEIVAHGKKPEVRACSLCHYPNGKGRPENAGIAGLPYDYILQEMVEFKNGERASADPRKPNTHFMIDFAKAMTEDEVKTAARYFSSMAWTPWIKVIETETVPKTRIQNGMFLSLEGDAREPIGQRIIETPVNAETTEQLRDPRSGFIAYVPVGSIKKGEALVMKGGGGKTTQCTICHAADLQGLGPVPGLAGRSPSYLVRQLYDIQHGYRTGIWTSLMKPVVANLSTDDMLAIAAYLTSRSVPPANSTTAGDSVPAQGRNFSSANK
jgi:cytochrome c553